MTSAYGNRSSPIVTFFDMRSPLATTSDYFKAKNPVKSSQLSGFLPYIQRTNICLH
ncbi:MAG: hypothetical protein KME54_25220 [Tolypothrix brevis GSE-NOS-MK-07-07A]|nr:hypothetical protein [Tolypothrix brevis GSE-NOS-MK-07-07A]